MKKFTSFLVTAAMLFSLAVIPVKAENNVRVMSDGDYGISLMSAPVDTIEGEGKLTEEEIKTITERAEAAFDDPANYIHDDNDNIDYIKVDVEDLDINLNEKDEEGNDVRTARADALQGLLFNIRSDNPKYFYLKNQIGLIFNNNKVVSAYAVLNRDISEIDAAKREIDVKVDEIITTMENDGINITAKDAKDEFDKALWLHDYLVNSITYDTIGANTNTANGTLDAALLDNFTVCEGYSQAYKYILEQLGMECVNVYSDTERHQWSAVKIGQEWYYVDVTQDDPLSNQLNNITHDFFLVNEDELLQKNIDPSSRVSGTHRDGYITEKDVTITENGTFTDKPWHMHKNGIKTGTVEMPDGTTQNVEYTVWEHGNLNGTVAFNGGKRYYGGFFAGERDENNYFVKNPYSLIYECESYLDEPKEFIKIPDSIWYVNQERNSYFPAYYGGIGKYVNTEKNESKLYFNSQTDIYSYDFNAEDPEPVSIYTYETSYTYEPPTETTNEKKIFNCLFGINVNGSMLTYETRDIIVTNNSITFTNYKTNEFPIDKLRVTFYDTDGENIVKVDEVRVESGSKLEIPEYIKYGYVINGWTEDITAEDVITLWDFENDTVKENMTLYAVSEELNWPSDQKLSISDGLLIGELDVSIGDFNEYQEAPSYILAVFENGALKAMKAADDGKFTFNAEDNIAYTEGTTTIKVYAWNDSLAPYLNSMLVTVPTESSPGEEGEGGGETGGKEGGGDESGDSGEKGDTGSEGGGDTGDSDNTGEETGGEEGGDSGDTEEGGEEETEGDNSGETGNIGE